MAVRMDYYELLGISQESNHEEIKKAFHQKIREIHPDKAKIILKTDSETKEFEKDNSELHMVYEAWKVLGVPEKRKEYDIKS